MSINRLRSTQKPISGFTIVEMLIIAPIVILVIGTFISAVVNMTGEILMTRGANALAYSIQDALNRIEADVKLSTTFLSINNITPTVPQGYNNNISNFTNVGANGNMLILNTLATTGNPLSSANGLVYLANQPNVCGSVQVNQNTPMTMNVIYFIKTVGVTSSLWRRSVMPSNYASAAGCVVPWQQPSCTPTIVSSFSFCKAQDVRLVDNVHIEDFVVQYFNSASATTADSIASSTGQTDNQRYAALQSDTTVVASLNVSKTIAGRDINQSGSIRSTRLDVNASTIAPAVPAVTPAAPTVAASIVPTVPTTATFTWASVQGTGTYTLDYRVDAWNPVTRTNSTGTWTNGFTDRVETNRTYSVTANHADKVYVRVKANSTDINLGSSPYGNSNITIPLWGSFQLQNLWTDYNSVYSSAGFTKTNAGIIVLKGMIKRSGTPVVGETIAILPAGYRPNESYMFTTSSGEAASRIDIFTDGRVVISSGNPVWLSLEGIAFIPSGSQYSWTAFSPLYSGWVNYGGSWATAGYTRDIHGRVFIKGLVANGTTTDGAVIGALPAGYRPPQYLHIVTTSNNAFDYSGFDTSGGMVAKGKPQNSYRSVQHKFYASGYGTWNNITLQNSWAQYGGYATAQYIKAPDGLVTVKGLIQGGSTGSGTVIANLPAGYRPEQTVLTIGVCIGGYCRIDILSNGDIIARAGVSATWTALDNITFLAEQ